MNMPPKNVLITGVAGFIGSNLLDYLMDNSNWIITGIDDLSTGRKNNISAHLESERFEFREHKVSELSSLKKFDLIFHLAALPRIQPSFELVKDHVKANVLEGVHLLELMINENHYPRLIYSSSSSIYGDPDQFPTPESSEIRCMNPYAFQKFELEQYIDILATRYPLDYVHLRYFNPYGKRSFNPDNKFNAYSSVVGIFIHMKKNGLPLKVTGDGTQERDFIHVMDVARANFMAATHPDKLNTAFNIGKGKTLSIIKLAELISDDYSFIDAREGEAKITLADITKANRILGWQPQLELEDFITDELKTERKPWSS